MDKIISFIIPSYNVEQYLEKCLSSFLNPQAIEQMEVIIVDDGSKDRTARIAGDYVKQYPELFRLILKENGGHGSAINAGTAAAVGRYLKVIDADDWVVTENLKELVDKLAVCTADVVLNPYHQVDMKTGEKTVWKMFLDRYEVAYTLEDVVQNWKKFDRCFAFHGICYNREFYQRHRYELPEKIFYEDHEYTTIPCSYAASIYPIDLYLYQYLVGNAEQSVSVTNRLKRMSHVEKVTEDLIRHYNAHPEFSDAAREYIYKKTEGVILSYYVAGCIMNPNKRTGRSDCLRYNTMIRNLKPEIWNRVSRKFRIYLWMNRFGISYPMYEKMLHSGVYNKLRHNHKLEKENEAKTEENLKSR